MIRVDAGCCNGCGLCIDLCPNHAIYLVDGLATVDSVLCSDCRSCIPACPVGAISLMPGVPPEPVPVPIDSAAPVAIPVRAPVAPVSLRARVLPVVGASLLWAGRELVPLVADAILDSLDRHQQKPASARKQPAPEQRVAGCRRGQGGGKRRQRHRRGNS